MDCGILSRDFRCGARVVPVIDCLLRGFRRHRYLDQPVCQRCGAPITANAISRQRRRDGTAPGKSKRGFASMSPDQVKRIASMGGTEAHRLKVAHTWSPEEAKQAGRIGGARTAVINAAKAEERAATTCQA